MELNTSNIRMNVVIFCFSSSCVSSARQTADVPANCENQFCMVFDFSGMEDGSVRPMISDLRLNMKFQRKWRKALVFLTTFCVKLRLLKPNWPE